MKALLELGYVARAHGLRGELGVRTLDPASETLFEVERIFLRRRGGTDEEPHIIRDARATPQGVLLLLEDVKSRNDAEALVGATVLVHREDLEPPAEGEYFQGDLIGMEAFDAEGRSLGRVAEIWETGPVPNLVIRQEGAEELVVPFVDDFVPEVDMTARRLVVRPPEFSE